MNSPLAFPSVDNSRGIASVLLINGLKGAEILLDACRAWPKNTDMEILGSLLSSCTEVVELPSSFMRNKKSPQCNFLFDGAALGMYLFGQDPRNSMGIIKRFKKSPLDLGSNRIGLDSKRQGLVFIEDSNCIFVMSLHIHAKDLRIFTHNWFKVLQKQMKKEKRGLVFGFSFQALLFVFRESASRLFNKAVRR
jgi:hypothetical protein